MRGKSQVTALLYYCFFTSCDIRNVSLIKSSNFTQIKCNTSLLPSPQADYSQTLSPHRLPFPVSA